MVIVSQDKYNILNFDTTVNIGVEEITTLSDIVQISAQTNGNTVILGRYDTQERAKEVLKEIAERYNELKRKTAYAMGDSEYTFDTKFYYEMPEE